MKMGRLCLDHRRDLQRLRETVERVGPRLVILEARCAVTLR